MVKIRPSAMCRGRESLQQRQGDPQHRSRTTFSYEAPSWLLHMLAQRRNSSLCPQPLMSSSHKALWVAL